MNREAICKIMEIGMEPFITDAGMNWHHPQVTAALARLRVAQKLWHDRRFDAGIAEQFGLFAEAYRAAKAEVAAIRARMDRQDAINNGPDGERHRYLKAQLRSNDQRPDHYAAANTRRHIEAQIAEIEARYV